MSIQAKKLELLKLILETENQSILESIQRLFRKESETDFWETLSENQKGEIIQGLHEIENGNVIDYEEFVKLNR